MVQTERDRTQLSNSPIAKPLRPSEELGLGKAAAKVRGPRLEPGSSFRRL
jgi:hypothetical protein